MVKRNLITLGILAGLVISLIVLFISRMPESTEKALEESEADPVSQILPLPGGEQIYDIIGSGGRKFRITQVTVNPLDVKTGQRQAVTVIVEDMDKTELAEENQVKATAFIDNDSVEFSLELIEASDKEQSLLTVWQGFWEFKGTYDFHYQLAVRAFKETDSDSVTLTFR